jgi:two-component sensor histidine kinase
MSDKAPTRILYIDNDVGIGRLVQKHLERYGYTVETAACGADGLRLLGEQEFDLVALDHYMEGKDGLATLTEIRKRPNPPPVVYVTGTTEGRVAIAALKAGAADYVVKDVSGTFLPLLRAAIESSLAARELRLLREAAQAEVREARDKFEALANERALLMREVNHRVSNSLQLAVSLLNMKAHAQSNPDVKDALLAAGSRVAAIGQVHRRLYNSTDVQAVALGDYLRLLMDDIARAMEDESANQVQLETDEMTATPDRAVAVGMIVTELVFNARKHAYPDGSGPVRVLLRRKDDTNATLTIEDEGIGMPSEESLRTKRGLGRTIVQAMASKLDATVRRDAVARGTRFVFDFALP